MRTNGNGCTLTPRPEAWPEPIPVSCPVHALGGLHLEPVSSRSASRLWNALIQRYHYLGSSPLPGAQLHSLIQWDGGVLGAIGFGAAAWKVAARDRWLGWTPEQRPSLDAMIRMIASLCGFLNRKSAGCPGPKTLLNWLAAHPGFLRALEAYRSVGGELWVMVWLKRPCAQGLQTENRVQLFNN